jgi:hypothetical protein
MKAKKKFPKKEKDSFFITLFLLLLLPYGGRSADLHHKQTWVDPKKSRERKPQLLLIMGTHPSFSLKHLEHEVDGESGKILLLKSSFQVQIQTRLGLCFCQVVTTFM